MFCFTQTRAIKRVMESIKVISIPCLKDNYAYLVIDPISQTAAAVDPVDPEKVLECMNRNNIHSLKYIITTHHHWDHSGGNVELKKMLGNDVNVVGYDDRIPALSTNVVDGTVFQFGNIRVKVLLTPCHTSGSACYYMTCGGDGVVFTGDTLFIGGCGRFFEGTAEDMNKSLNEVLARLPNETLIYCGHEYTADNLRFALTVDSQNLTLQKAYNSLLADKSSRRSSIPSTIGQEKQLNPFMRVNNPDIQKSLGYVGKTDPVTIMQHLRELKNNFK